MKADDKKKINRAREFELLSKLIFQTMVGSGAGKSLDIQHDVVIQGKTTCHQIDVFWKFEIGGVVYSALVQCKNWKRPIPKGELLKFKEVLDDIPFQPRGIFVSRTGYQDGALEVAIKCGIELYELRPPEPCDLLPYARSQGFHLALQLIHIEELTVESDSEWIANECKRMGVINEQQSIVRGRGGFAHSTKLFDENGEYVGSVLDQIQLILDQICSKQQINIMYAQSLHGKGDFHFRYESNSNLYIIDPALKLPRIRIRAISGQLVVGSEFHELFGQFRKLAPHLMRKLTNVEPGVDNWWNAVTERPYIID
jgi:hypothetical protein